MHFSLFTFHFYISPPKKSIFHWFYKVFEKWNVCGCSHRHFTFQKPYKTNEILIFWEVKYKSEKWKVKSAYFTFHFYISLFTFTFHFSLLPACASRVHVAPRGSSMMRFLVIRVSNTQGVIHSDHCQKIKHTRIHHWTQQAFGHPTESLQQKHR